MDISNNKNNSENFLDIMENEEQKYNVETNAYTICNKNNCVFKNTYNLYVKKYIENNPIEVGPSIAYSYTKIDKSNLNGANVSIASKFRLEDYKLIVNAMQNFRYTNIQLSNKKKINYYTIDGGLNLKLNLNTKINFIPELRFSYDYGIKSKFMDEANDVIILNDSFDASIGIGLNLEYVFGDKTKVKLGAGYAFDKEFYYKKKYQIYERELKKEINDDMNHTGKIYTVISLNNKHNIKLLLDYKSKMFGGAFTYNYNW